MEEWHAARQAWEAARRANEPARERNRRADRFWELSRAIAHDVSLRSQVVELCGLGSGDDTRLGAALIREHWDVEGAVRTMLEIVEVSGAQLPRPVTMASALAVDTTSTARSAALCVYNLTWLTIGAGRGGRLADLQ